MLNNELDLICSHIFNYYCVAFFEAKKGQINSTKERLDIWCLTVDIKHQPTSFGSRFMNKMLKLCTFYYSCNFATCVCVCVCWCVLVCLFIQVSMILAT